MQQADLDVVAQRAREFVARLGGVAQVDRLALLDQRADPVHLPALRDLRLDAVDDLVAPVVGHQLGDDGRAARRQLVERGDVEVGVVAHRERAGDGRGAHHQQVRFQMTTGLAAQC
ncbi:hypothetical protein D3C72_1555240 [compost metagenome]